MLAALWLVAQAADDGKKIVLSMLVVGIVFVAVIALGEAAHHLAVKRRAERANRPL